MSEYFSAIVGVASGLTVFLIVGAGFLFHRARKNAKAAEEVEYPGMYLFTNHFNLRT